MLYPLLQFLHLFRVECNTFADKVMRLQRCTEQCGGTGVAFRVCKEVVHLMSDHTSDRSSNEPVRFLPVRAAEFAGNEPGHTRAIDGHERLEATVGNVVPRQSLTAGRCSTFRGLAVSTNVDDQDAAINI